jgi:hypothetical protein
MNQDLIGRVRRLLMSPATEWDVIDREPSDMAAIYKSYVLPLIVFMAVCQGIGALFLGGGFFWVLRGILLTILLGSAGIYLLALVINALATTFGAQKNFGQAFKVAAYTPTASWVASVFYVIPMLGIVAMLAGLFSFYLLFVGLPKLMRCPGDQAFLYTGTVIACLIVATLVLSLLLFPILY